MPNGRRLLAPVIAFAALLITQKGVCAPPDQSRNAAALLEAAKAARIELDDVDVNKQVMAAATMAGQLANQLISQKQMNKRQWCQNTQTSLDKAREDTLWEVVSRRR